MTKVCVVYNLGLVDYHQGLLLQEKLLDSRKSGAISDVLLLLQHPSVFTTGRSSAANNIIVGKDVLDKEGIQIIYTNRGGDITYHGPGQIVGYPILSLRENDLTVYQYVWSLEEIIVRTLADYGINGQRVAGRRGVWVGDEKICSIGLRVSRAISMHGFALNVNTDLKYFSYIVPCGLNDVSVTSLSKLSGSEVAIEETQEILLQHFCQVFSFKLEYEKRPDEWPTLLNLNG